VCGINGYIQFGREKNEDSIKLLIGEMNDKIIHRGPDEDGLYADGKVGLGMRRLSIIGLKDGQQPIFNEDKTLLIIFNGEIYNYKSLKADLVGFGHIFKTSSDTEVILHAFEEYGTDCFKKLKGMYALAIYDLKKEKIIITRDLAGEKPLHYYIDEERLVFASEIKSMFCSDKIKKQIDKDALNRYLSLTYIPAPLTIYKNIYKLLPGHYIEVDLKGNHKITKYWDIVYDDKKLITDYDECKNILRETMFNAVEECMVADVPVGAFLSGGIDSSTVVGIMSRLSKKPIDTFTICYKDKYFDESDLARKTAEINKTNHHEFILDYDEVFDEIDNIVNALDEPFADSSAIPTYMVSKHASKHVKTVLTGDAGDELFAGYQKYLIGYYAAKFNKIPKILKEGIIKKAVYAIPDKTPITRKARKVIDNANKSVFEQRLNLMSLGFKDYEKIRLLNSKYQIMGSLDFIKEYYNVYEGKTAEISLAQYTDFKVVLEGDMFHKVDRMSMHHSLETRSPIVHKDVVELAARIPSKYKINDKNTKMILKDTFKDILPPDVLKGKKRGFSVPIGKWLSSQLKDELLRLLDKDFINAQGLFNYNFIKEILDEHMSMKKNRFSELWLLFVFQRWYKREFKI
jgi:asparagine synthase (glutamine-hydrolysing)